MSASGTSSIHYRFENDLDLKRLSFEGIHISLDEVRKIICQKEGINLEYVDIAVKNADTRRVYEGTSFIPRNSTVTITRVPRKTPIKIPKVSNIDASGAIPQKPTTSSPIIGHINEDDFAKMSEDERLKHVRMISTQKYNPINYTKKFHQNSTVTPDFKCFRCNNLGHHPKQCPMQSIRRTTGIPSEELMAASPSDPNALLHSSGGMFRYVIPIMHYKARETRKLVDKVLYEREKQLANNKDISPNESISVPAELECPLCHNLLRDALLAPCCGESFCAECIQSFMLNATETDEGPRCPTCPVSKPISVDTLVPNKRIRDAVLRHKNSIASNTPSSNSKAIPLAAVPVAAHDLSKLDTDYVIKSPSELNKTPDENKNGVMVLPTVNLSAILSKQRSPTTSQPNVSVSTTMPNPPYAFPVKNVVSTIKHPLSNQLTPPFQQQITPLILNETPHLPPKKESLINMTIAPPPCFNGIPNDPVLWYSKPKVDTHSVEYAMSRAWNSFNSLNESMDIFSLQNKYLSTSKEPGSSKSRKRSYRRLSDEYERDHDHRKSDKEKKTLDRDSRRSNKEGQDLDQDRRKSDKERRRSRSRDERTKKLKMDDDEESEKKKDKKEKKDKKKKKDKDKSKHMDRESSKKEKKHSKSGDKREKKKKKHHSEKERHRSRSKDAS